MIKADILTFLGAYIRSPSQVGSVCPSSKYLGLSIANEVQRFEKIQLVQIGGGTGSITKYLPHNLLTVLETDKNLATKLTKRHPKADIKNQCGADYLLHYKKDFGCIVNVPLIGNVNAKRLKDAISLARQNGFLKWCIIYTYGNKSPLDDIGFLNFSKSKRIWRNIPPATVWIYW